MLGIGVKDIKELSLGFPNCKLFHLITTDSKLGIKFLISSIKVYKKLLYTSQNLKKLYKIIDPYPNSVCACLSHGLPNH